MSFHFIRPMWLLALLPIALVLFALLRQNDSARAWRGVVAQHLLPFLISGASGTSNRVRPHLLLAAVLAIVTIALAGPAWNREPAPFADDEAALVIAIEVTPTMLAQDVQPSRLARATHKIRDLLELRQGAATALVAYSGSAHLVMPLTEDGDLIAQFAAELDPGIMPIEGDAADEAIALAQKQLVDTGRAGSVLLISDSVAPDVIERIAGTQTGILPKVHVFGIGAGAEAVVPAESPPAPPLNPRNLEEAADAGRGAFVVVTPDAEDVELLAGTIETQFTAAATAEGGQRWKDAGYWLTPVIAVLALVWFRPGWTVQWNTAAIAVACCLLATPDAQAGDSWFSTQDQSAQRLYDAGEFAQAAERFTDPMHQGMAWFKAGEFKNAAAAFGRTGTAEGIYNRGNAFIMLGKYEGAIQSYEAALKKRPGWKQAEDNLNLAKLRLARLAPPDNQQSQKGRGEDDRPDEIVFDDRAKDKADANTEVIAGEGQELTDKALRAQWLRRVQTKPADYLKLKFLYQYQVARSPGGEEATK